MPRLMLWLAFVLTTTLLGGVVGGAVGGYLGRTSPSFVHAVSSPRPTPLSSGYPPEEFGYGLGVVSGLMIGVGVGLTLVVCACVRDVWLERLRAGLARHSGVSV